MIPPKQNAAFVAAMEDVLEVYHRPHDPEHPVGCMDEQPIQLVKKTRVPIPMDRRKPRRFDYEYERAGTASAFLFLDPLAGWRRVRIRQRRTKIDWAEEVRELLEEDCPEAETVTLVMDNLNTHGIASLYAAFPAPLALLLAKRLDIHHRPVHGSRLNVAECELSVFTRQCLTGRPEASPPRAGRQRYGSENVTPGRFE